MAQISDVNDLKISTTALKSIKFKISVKSFEYTHLEQSVKQIVKILKFYGMSGLKVAAFPTAKKKFSVVRSPHVHKKSQEQFELKTFKKCIICTTVFVNSDKQKALVFLLKTLKNTEFYGVQIKIECSYITAYN